MSQASTYPSPTSATSVTRRTSTGSHVGQLPRFRIDDYGSDPSGATSSDAAWTAVYAAAVASITGAGASSVGAMIEFGPGIYSFSINKVKVSDYRIGICGAGKQVTQIKSTGNTGDIVYVTDTGIQGFMSAPCFGFTIWGFGAGVNTNGFHYGDRAGALLDDIEVIGCQAVGSRNFLFRNDNGSPAGCEGTVARLNSQQGGVSCVTFDGNNSAAGAGSNTFDYSDWRIQGVGQAVGQNHNFVEIINKGQVSGCRLLIQGNLQANVGFTATILTVGNSAADISQLTFSDLLIVVEGDTSAGTLKDLTVIADASFGGGILECTGIFRAVNVTGNFVAGTATGNVLCSIVGHLNAPFFSTLGVLASIGQLNAFDLYPNQIRGIIDSTGAVRPGSTAGPGTTREWEGAGAPTTPGGAIAYLLNDRYWRTDGALGSRLYICTTGGGAPAWTAAAAV